jgi:hypothetical protein
MTIAYPQLHIICGACGCKDELSFKIDPKGNCDYEGNEYPAVYVYCKNCSFLVNLGDVIPQSL